VKEKSPRVCRAADADRVNQPTRLRMTAIEGHERMLLWIGVTRVPGVRPWDSQVGTAGNAAASLRSGEEDRWWEELANVAK